MVSRYTLFLFSLILLWPEVAAGTNGTISTVEVRITTDGSNYFWKQVSAGETVTFKQGSTFYIRLNRSGVGSSPWTFIAKSPSGIVESQSITYVTSKVFYDKSEVGQWSVAVDSGAWFVFTMTNGRLARTARAPTLRT